MEDHGKTRLPSFVFGRTRAQWVTLLFALIILLDIVNVVSNYSEIGLLSRMMDGETVSMAEAMANDNRQSTIYWLYLLAFALCTIAFLMWMHHAHRNLPALGVQDLRFTPGWAVGWFFVPLFWFFRPYQVAKEIWKGSDPNALDGQSWKDMPSSALVRWWWAFFLIMNLGEYIVLRIYLSSDGTLPELIADSWGALITNALSIPAALFTILIVRAIDARQEEKHKLLITRTASPDQQI